MTRVLVCGGRDFNDEKMMYEELDKILDNGDGDEYELVSGHAKGADILSEKYAKDRHIRIKVFPVDWKRYGKVSGIKRNKDMLDYVSQENPVVVAFWDGNSTGTKNTIDTARKTGIEPIVIFYNKSS